MNLDQAKLRRAAFLLTFACAVAPLFSIAASHTLMGVSFAVILLSRERLQLPPIGLPLALFLGGTILSLLVSGSIWAGRAQIRKFYVFLILVCVATTFRGLAQVRSLAMWWIAAGTCSALFGLVQFYRQWETLPPAISASYLSYISHRITGFMSHWMTFSGQLMMVLLLLIAFLMFSPDRRKRLWPIVGAGTIIVLALVLALTRGVWIGTAMGVVYLVYCWNRKWLLALPVLAVAGFVASPHAVQERVESAVRPHGEVDSNQHRIVTWRTGLEMIKAHPVFGLGPEQVGKQFNQYVPADIHRPLPEGWYGHLHNIYLQYAAERGIPTMLMMLWLLVKVLYDFWRALANAARAPSDASFVLHGSIAMLIGTMVTGLFEHNLGDSEFLQMFLTTIAIGYVAVNHVRHAEG
jgi:O-antigen ligase